MSFWNEKTIEELRRLAPDHTAGEIAAIMRAPTRNVIVGKIFRLGLTRNPDKPRGQARPRIERAPRARTRPWNPNAGAACVEPLIRSGEGNPSVTPDCGRPGAMPPQARAEPAGELPATAVDIWSLSAQACRWPLWGPDEPASKGHYCGARVARGLMYCQLHCYEAFA